jgi:hypothetical protein
VRLNTKPGTDIIRVVIVHGETKLLLNLILRMIYQILVGRYSRSNQRTRLRPGTGVTRYYDFTVARNTIAPDGVQQAVIVVNGQYPVSFNHPVLQAGNKHCHLLAILVSANR